MFPCIVKTGWSPPVGSRSEHIQSSTFQLQQCSFSKYMVIYLKPDPPLAFSKTGRISETIFSVFLLLRQFLNCHSKKSKHRHLEFFELHLFDLKTTLDCILCISYRTSIDLHPSETSLESIHDKNKMNLTFKMYEPKPMYEDTSCTFLFIYARSHA